MKPMVRLFLAVLLVLAGTLGAPSLAHDRDHDPGALGQCSSCCQDVGDCAAVSTMCERVCAAAIVPDVSAALPGGAHPIPVALAPSRLVSLLHGPAPPPPRAPYVRSNMQFNSGD